MHLQSVADIASRDGLINNLGILHDLGLDEIIAPRSGKASKNPTRIRRRLIRSGPCDRTDPLKRNRPHKNALARTMNMARQDYTPHQQNIISGYYKNLDTIMLAKLQELVTELYLADTQAKRDRLWKRVEQAMTKLHIPATLAGHIMAAKDVEILAANLQDWLKKKGTASGRP